MSKANIADLAVGTKVRVVLEGEVVTVAGAKRVKIGERLSPASYRMVPETIPPRALTVAKSVEIVGPKWQPGDVVVVRYTPRGIAYTYVRGISVWPGERAASKTDAEITALFGEGKVEHVLRDGKPVVKPISAGQINVGAISAETLRPGRIMAPRPGGRTSDHLLYGTPYPF